MKLERKVSTFFFVVSIKQAPLANASFLVYFGCANTFLGNFQDRICLFEVTYSTKVAYQNLFDAPQTTIEL